MLQGVLQCVAVCCSLFLCVAVGCSGLQWVVLQCFVMCCDSWMCLILDMSDVQMEFIGAGV